MGNGFDIQIRLGWQKCYLLPAFRWLSVSRPLNPVTPQYAAQSLESQHSDVILFIQSQPGRDA
jgi:hypothetical protein